MMVKVQEPDVNQCAEMARACACLGFRKASRSVTQFYDQLLAPCGLRSTLLAAAPLWQQAQDALREKLGHERLARVLKDLTTVTDAVRKSS